MTQKERAERKREKRRRERERRQSLGLMPFVKALGLLLALLVAGLIFWPEMVLRALETAHVLVIGVGYIIAFAIYIAIGGSGGGSRSSGSGDSSGSGGDSGDGGGGAGGGPSGDGGSGGGGASRDW